MRNVRLRFKLLAGATPAIAVPVLLWALWPSGAQQAASSPTDFGVQTYVAERLEAASTPQPGEAILLAAGDIASCDGDGDEATALLLHSLAGTVITLGDNVYGEGTASQFRDCYGPSWGRHRARTRPSVGNHEYKTEDASGYLGYFGAAAGDPAKGYYSYYAGAWHIIALNTNCGEVGGCDEGSPQERWLRADLAAHPARCTLAYAHHPRFSSGSSHGNTPSLEPIWRALYDAGAEIVLAGHEHNYERFAPQTPDGDADGARGIVQFVVGTGGRSHYGFGDVKANSIVRNGDTYGVLRLVLTDGAYAWEFVAEAGKSFTDAGAGRCH